MLPEYRPEAYVDFTKPENVKKQQDAIKRVEAQFDREYPLFIGGNDVKSSQTFQTFNPCQKDQVVGTFHKATQQHVDQAMDAAHKAWRKWRHFSAEERATVLFRAAQIMRRDKFDLNAWMIMETGKSYAEAEGDTSEAIDFLEFYAREALRYDNLIGATWFPNEFPTVRYIPLGVGAIIPPWNFPLAILTGMTVAAIVAGNAVLLKPASDSPAIGYRLVEVMREAGLPDGILNFIPGSGSEIGDYLVEHPQTRFIAFTGSKEVGLRINKLAAKLSPGQIWIKRVLVEMGGKDTIVVNSDANLEAAAAGVVGSAFGYQGQKCSACSRVIILDDIYDKFIEMIKERTEKIKMGPVKDPSNFMGGVINQASEEKILSYIEIGKKDGTLVTGGNKANDKGYYIEPTIFKDIPPGSQLDQEEIFGPVLACLKAKSYDEALELANATEYGLTGSVYATDRYLIDQAKREFHVGNLYVNRKCTGSIVGVHPFGGYNMSGTNSKTGSFDYLGLFLQSKSISEQLL